MKVPTSRITGAVDPKQAFADLQRRTTQRLRIPTVQVTPPTPDGESDTPFFEGQEFDRLSPAHARRPVMRPTLVPVDTQNLEPVRERREHLILSVKELTPPSTPVARQHPAGPRLPVNGLPAPRPSVVVAGPINLDVRPTAPLMPAVLTTTSKDVDAYPSSHAAYDVAPPTPPPSATAQPLVEELFLGPGGLLRAEHQLDDRYIEYQLRRQDFPHMSVGDWQRLSDLLTQQPLIVRPEAWVSFATLIASLPIDEQPQAIRVLHQILDDRLLRNLEPAPASLFVAMQQLPVSSYIVFAAVARKGMAKVSHVTGVELRTLKTLAEGFGALDDDFKLLLPHKKHFRWSAQGVCAAAERLAQQREVTLSAAERRQACLPLDEHGVARILEICLAEGSRALDIIDHQAFVVPLVDMLVKKAQQPGPIPAELLSAKERANGERVAEALFAEFVYRMGSHQRPSQRLARAMYKEGHERAKARLVADHIRNAEEPKVYAKFKARFGALFDHYGWDRALTSVA